MDVAISVLRAELATWLERARAGEDVVVTERGTPIVRLMAIGATPLLEELTRSGVLSSPQTNTRPSARSTTRVRADGPVAKLVSEQRRG